jgi:uncharacterized membrane protein YdbT with pleckstrin-like domain
MLRRHREPTYLDARQHAVVLVVPFAKAIVLTAAGGFLVVRGGLLAAPGAAACAVGALLALRAVWRWERTRVVVTSETVAVAHGTLRRRTASVPLDGLDAVEIEQSLLGRALGYGTLILGPLEIDHVPRPAAVTRVVERLAAAR